MLTGTMLAIMSAVSVIAADSRYPAASNKPWTRPDYQANQAAIVIGAPADEAQSGISFGGTPMNKFGDDCFPAEQRNIFWKMNQVQSGPGGALQPLNFDADRDGRISDKERDAIRGINTWILWTEGNDSFWDWQTRYGYGMTDFLIMLDSRKRSNRFKETGLINQPGLHASTRKEDRILGLYLDRTDGTQGYIPQAPDDFADVKKKLLAAIPSRPAGCPEQSFVPGDRKLYDETIAMLPKDGVDPLVYGYPSGVMGMRLFPNPDFFGNTEHAAQARKYWNERVVNTNDAYYFDRKLFADPKLVRPFRAGMACGYCHVGISPAAPPADPDNPQWENLSATIGNQFWEPQKCVANTAQPTNFLYHFLQSQQPGTIDTSMVPTDYIVNPSNINTIASVPTRLRLAKLNPPQAQSDINMLLPGVEDGGLKANPSHVARILKDGADSAGILAATARVYLNIGTFVQEWFTCHNPLLGFVPQKPFSIAKLTANSVYWRSALKHRLLPVDEFFLLEHKSNAPYTMLSPVKNASTSAARLIHTPEGKALLSSPFAQQQVAKGRALFIQNCAICHSSKQPDGFDLSFSDDWNKNVASTTPGAAVKLVLPARFSQWDAFTSSAGYKHYVDELAKLAGTGDAFFDDNFLSNDRRIPVTLVGTNSSRAVATNAMRGQMWDNFSSETYKNLPAVGAVRFYNPFSNTAVDAYGRNDEYAPPSGGPGYYRTPSLLGIWATAPFMNNNCLGLYNHDPSVKGRIAAFDDAMKRMLAGRKRMHDSAGLRGDLRAIPQLATLAARDPGFIYRTPNVTWIDVPAPFIKQVLTGVIGPFLTEVLTSFALPLLALGIAVLAWFAGSRTLAIFLLVVGLLKVAFLMVSHFDHITPILWLAPAAFLIGSALVFFKGATRLVVRGVLGTLAALTLISGIAIYAFVNGALGNALIGPIPAGTPVNLIMNTSPQGGLFVLADAGLSLLRGCWVVGTRNLSKEQALQTFEDEAAPGLMRANKCPDWVQDEGHYFGENLSDSDKASLIMFVKTL